MEALPEIVTEHLDEVRALCEKYRVKRLAIFGSAVKGTFDPETSDLDFVVEFFPQPGAGWGDVSYRLQEDLERLSSGMSISSSDETCGILISSKFSI